MKREAVSNQKHGVEKTMALQTYICLRFRSPTCDTLLQKISWRVLQAMVERNGCSKQIQSSNSATSNTTDRVGNEDDESEGIRTTSGGLRT